MRNKGPGFTDQAMFAKLQQMQDLGVSMEVFFTYGVPWEKERDLNTTLDLRRRILKEFSLVRGLRALSIEMEPGAPWFESPDRFGVISQRSSFDDFYRAHSDGEEGTYTDLGYAISDFFDEPLDADEPHRDFQRRLQEIKGRDLRFLHFNPKKVGSPRMGRFVCRAGQLMRLARGRQRGRPE